MQPPAKPTSLTMTDTGQTAKLNGTVCGLWTFEAPNGSKGVVFIAGILMDKAEAIELLPQMDETPFQLKARPTPFNQLQPKTN